MANKASDGAVDALKVFEDVYGVYNRFSMNATSYNFNNTLIIHE